MSGSRSAARYIPALDGLRAVAVGAVVAYHLGLPWARGGYLGVDLFFVLSGFLITGLLVEERHRSGRIDLRQFYRRRARRLLPALFVVLTGVSLWVAAARTGVDRAQLRGDVLAALGYVANWRFVFSHQGYFEQFSLPSPIRHMWSLAIEEQFYVLWPLMLIGLLRLGRGSRRVAQWATVTLAAVSVGDMAVLYHAGADPSRAYYGTDTRAFELMAGAVLALLVTGRPDPAPRLRRVLQAGGALGFGGLVWMMATVPDTAGWMYRGGFALAAVAAAAAVWSVSRTDAGWLGAALAVGPLRWIGLISYGIYLWHWPVIDLLTRSSTGLSGNRLRLAQVAVTVGGAAVSYVVVERPVRQGRRLRRRGWAGASVGVTATVTALLMATATAAPATVLPAPARVAAPPLALASARRPPSTAPPVALPPVLDLRGGRPVTAQDPLRVLLVGDSVMWDASLGIQAALQATGPVTVDVRAVLGFGLTRSWYPWRTAWARLVAADRPDLVVALFGAWDLSQVLARGPAWYAGLVDQAVGVLTAGGARLVFLEFPRNQTPDVPGRPPRDRAADERSREAANAVFAGSAARFPGTVAYLPLGPVLDDAGRFAAFLPGAGGTLERVRKRDDLHFCPAGAARVGGWVLAAVGPAFGLPPADPAWAGGAWRADPRYDLPHGACI